MVFSCLKHHNKDGRETASSAANPGQSLPNWCMTDFGSMCGSKDVGAMILEQACSEGGPVRDRFWPNISSEGAKERKNKAD